MVLCRRAAALSAAFPPLQTLCVPVPFYSLLFAPHGEGRAQTVACCIDSAPGPVNNPPNGFARFFKEGSGCVLWEFLHGLDTISRCSNR